MRHVESKLLNEVLDVRSGDPRRLDSTTCPAASRTDSSIRDLLLTATAAEGEPLGPWLRHVFAGDVMELRELFRRSLAGQGCPSRIPGRSARGTNAWKYAPGSVQGVVLFQGGTTDERLSVHRGFQSHAALISPATAGRTGGLHGAVVVDRSARPLRGTGTGTSPTPHRCHRAVTVDRATEGRPRLCQVALEALFEFGERGAHRIRCSVPSRPTNTGGAASVGVTR